MLTLTITDEQLQVAFDNHIEKLLDKDNYSNPVKSVLDNLLGHSGSLKGELGDKIKAVMTELMSSQSFRNKLGDALATEIAKRQANALLKK